MRTGLFLAATLTAATLSQQPTAAADPPVVFQTQPVGRVLDDFRSAATLLGGEKGAKAFNDAIKAKLGEKGFEGLDLNRPVVGYFLIPADPKDTVVVLALPVAGEKEFVEFCERWNGSKPKALKDGLYELPPLGPPLKAVVRVVEGYAYIATGVADPSPALDAKALVPAGKLFDPNEQALATARVYFDRFPPGLREKLAEYLKAGGMALGGADPVWKDILAPLLKMANRYFELSKDAKEAALRIKLDPAGGDLAAEFTLTANPGTPLDKIISGRKPTTNRFAGLLTPDTAAGAVFSLPLFNDEVRESAVTGLEALRKEAANNAPAQAKPVLEELLKGLIRTVKSGEFDVALAIRGPDKNGLFTAIQAVSFDDPSALEKELKKLIEAEAPPEVKDAIKWDAAKAGNVSIHTLDMAKLAAAGGGRGGPDVRRTFGDNAVAAFAFAPKAIVMVTGPDAVEVLKGLLALKPGEAPALEAVANPDRLRKFVGAIADEQAAAQLTEVLGSEDKLTSAASLTVAGGKELKVTLAVNLKILPRAFLYTVVGRAAGEAPQPAIKK